MRSVILGGMYRAVSGAFSGQETIRRSWNGNGDLLGVDEIKSHALHMYDFLV